MQTKEMTPIVKVAMKTAINAHDIECNQKYGDHPYSTHLNAVYEIALEFERFIPPGFQEIVYCGCWLHDAIEDARLTYNDIKNEFGRDVAELVYACTNEKGRTRKDRANAFYYAGIRATPFASFVKMCDRIANVKNAKKDNYRMFLMYQKENAEFLYNVAHYDTEMGQYLNELFNEL